MLRLKLQKTSKISVGIFSAIFIIFGEGILIYSVDKLGVLWTILVFVAACYPITIYLQEAFESYSINHKPFVIVNRWVARLESQINPKYVVLANTSKALAILVASLLSGVFTTAILIEVLGYKRTQARVYSLIVNIIFYSVWSLIYGGIINVASLFIK